jgi:hypothetical protein
VLKSNLASIISEKGKIRIRILEVQKHEDPADPESGTGSKTLACNVKVL